MSNNQSNKLLQLVEQYPDLPVVPMVWYEIVCDDSSSYWIGSFESVRKTAYYVQEDNWGASRVYFSEDRDELCDVIFEKMCEELGIDEVSDEDLENRINSLKWIDCIVVYIGLPE